MKKNIVIVFLLSVIVVILALNFKFTKQEETPSPEYVMCTSEAKICPDGSTVIRTGSKCEFAACPSVDTTSTISNVEYENKIISGRKLVYFRSVKQDGLSVLVTVDPIEMFSGDRATEAAMQDTKCSKEKVIVCAPSLNNSFYIRNLSKDTQTLALTLSTRVYLSSETNSANLKKISLLDLKKKYDEGSLGDLAVIPFVVTVKDGNITQVEQQYIP